LVTWVAGGAAGVLVARKTRLSGATCCHRASELWCEENENALPPLYGSHVTAMAKELGCPHLLQV
jgi:hypothetical protein